MLQLFQKWNFSNCSRWHSFFLAFQPYFLQCHRSVCFLMPSFIYNPISPWKRNVLLVQIQLFDSSYSVWSTTKFYMHTIIKKHMACKVGGFLVEVTLNYISFSLVRLMGCRYYKDAHTMYTNTRSCPLTEKQSSWSMTFADGGQRAPTLRDILSVMVQYPENVQQGRQELQDLGHFNHPKYAICQLPNEKNVPQGIKMYASTLKACQTFCAADLK